MVVIVIGRLEPSRTFPEKHADLWKVVIQACIPFPPDHYACSRIKGHTEEYHVSEGIIMEKQRKGNKGADSAASQGALKHALPAHIIEAANVRKAFTMAIQQCAHCCSSCS